MGSAGHASAVRGQQRLDVPARGVVDPGNDEVLLSGDHERHVEAFGQLAQCRAQPHLMDVAYAPGPHAQAQSPGPVAVGAPPEVVVGRSDDQVRCLAQRRAVARLNLAGEGLEPPVGDDVLHSGPAPVGTVPEVAIGRQDRADQVVELVVSDEGERVGQSREGVGLGVRASEATTDDDRESLSDLIVYPRYQANVLGEHVDAIFVGCATAILNLRGR